MATSGRPSGIRCEAVLSCLAGVADDMNVELGLYPRPRAELNIAFVVICE